MCVLPAYIYTFIHHDVKMLIPCVFYEMTKAELKLNLELEWIFQAGLQALKEGFDRERNSESQPHPIRILPNDKKR